MERDWWLYAMRTAKYWTVNCRNVRPLGKKSRVTPTCGSYLRSNTFFFFFSSRRRHTRLQGDWSSDVCSSDLIRPRRPQQNGKVERSHRIDQEEFWGRHRFTDLDEATTALRAWERTYNYEQIGRASCRERV